MVSPRILWPSTKWWLGRRRWRDRVLTTRLCACADLRRNTCGRVLVRRVTLVHFLPVYSGRARSSHVKRQEGVSYHLSNGISQRPEKLNWKFSFRRLQPDLLSTNTWKNTDIFSKNPTFEVVRKSLNRTLNNPLKYLDQVLRTPKRATILGHPVLEDSWPSLQWLNLNCQQYIACKVFRFPLSCNTPHMDSRFCVQF